MFGQNELFLKKIFILNNNGLLSETANGFFVDSGFCSVKLI